MRYFIGFAAAVLLAFLAAGLVVYAGAYDIAATDRHAGPVRWMLDTAMQRSVERQAEGIAPPQAFTEEQVRQGVASFEAMCVHCHGAPGKDPQEWAQGLRPAPPRLSEAAGQWSRAELFWIVGNGIKMSGMPAFGPSHEDGDIWSIVALLERLPELDGAAYARLASEAEGSGHHGSGGEGGESRGGHEGEGEAAAH